MNAKTIPSLGQIKNYIYLLQVIGCTVLLSLLCTVLKLITSLHFLSVVSWVILLLITISSIALFFIMFNLMENKIKNRYAKELSTVHVGVKIDAAWELYEEELNAIKIDRINAINELHTWLKGTNLCSDGVAPVVGWRKLL